MQQVQGSLANKRGMTRTGRRQPRCCASGLHRHAPHQQSVRTHSHIVSVVVLDEGEPKAIASTFADTLPARGETDTNEFVAVHDDTRPTPRATFSLYPQRFCSLFKSRVCNRTPHTAKMLRAKSRMWISKLFCFPHPRKFSTQKSVLSSDTQVTRPRNLSESADSLEFVTVAVCLAVREPEQYSFPHLPSYS